MPMVPRENREAYRQWAKDNFKAQMDERAWVHESDWQEFLLALADDASHDVEAWRYEEHKRLGLAAKE